MSTGTPTNSLPGATLPPGLPDVATLARLAGEIFNTPPGAEATASALSVQVPASPQNAAGLAARPLALTPSSQSPTGLPDVAASAGPPAMGRASGPLLGVPEAYAAAVPIVTGLSGAQAAAVSPETPAYYFLGESSAAPRAADPGFYFIDTLSPAGHGGEVPQVGGSAHPPFDVHAVRRDFPILSERVNGRPLAWLDNAATTQKPRAVIERLSYFYQHENSNIHRGAHELAARATDAYEAARSKVARFLRASSPEEIVFVRGTTEGINLVAQSWARRNLGAGDEIVLSHLEHHANIVPWQQVASERGAKIRVIPVDDSGQVLLEEYRRLLNDRTRMVAVSQVSNALGTVVPVKEIVELAHRAGAKALVDGAQSVAHMRVDLQALDADFFVFSGHKIFAPTGIGAVYGKRELLEQMPPWQGGGNMISDVTFERTLYAAPPARFEAGTGNIADAVGLGTALDYLERLSLENVGRYEHELLEYGMQALRTVPGLRLIGTAKEKASVMSFVLDGHSVEEVSKALNQEGIAVRAGHHCAQPILRRFGVEATVRPSLAFYNTCEEIDRLIAVLYRLTGGRRVRN
jgi:cysteine desulfurase/selenocysteine lyase